MEDQSQVWEHIRQNYQRLDAKILGFLQDLSDALAAKQQAEARAAAKQQRLSSTANAQSVPAVSHSHVSHSHSMSQQQSVRFQEKQVARFNESLNAIYEDVVVTGEEDSDSAKGM